MRSRLALPLAVLATAAVGVGAARAEQPTAAPRSLLFEIGAPHAEQRALAYDEALRDAGPAPLARGVLQPDGSLRVGDASVNVSVRHPCPLTSPGMMYDVPPLPGRRAR